MSAAGSPTDRPSQGFSRLIRRALFPLALSAAFAMGAPGPLEPNKTLMLGYVESQPAPGRAPVPLEQSVVRIRQEYGRSVLVEMTHAQEMVLRKAGYEIHLVENGYRIGLGRYAFDVPAGPEGLPSDLLWRERKGETETNLVRLIGPATDEWLSRLRLAGGEILTPIPAFTYLVRMSPQGRQGIAALPFVEWIGPYHPAFKLSSALASMHERGSLPESAGEYQVLIYRSADVEKALNSIRGMGGEIQDRIPFDFYDLITLTISGRRLPDLARMSEVYAVEQLPYPRLEDESSTQILAGQITAENVPFKPALAEPSYQDWLSARILDGSGVTIGYADNGVLNADPSGHLTGRVNESVCGSAGSQGHGHFGAAAAGGACAHPTEGGTGFHYGLGVAPNVNFINLPFLKSNGGACTHNDVTRARDTVTSTGPNGALGTIQNNSWGDNGNGTNLIEDVSYTSTERTFDMLTRDADSVAAGNQPLITCFSAGNEGNNTGINPPYACPLVNGDKDCASSLTRPHAAKNIIVTGSSSVYRFPNAVNIEDRSTFSSQGPSYDGRVKPDLMAPGGAASGALVVSSAFVAGYGTPVGDGVHSFNAGTSFASPQTAGAAALLIQWWQRFAAAVPSPALVKAFLVNSARDLQGGNTPDFIPNRHEGWGRWNLGNILDPSTPTVALAPPLFKKTSGLPAIYLDQGVVFGNTGDQFQVRLAPADLGKPLKATLAWTDAPGAVSSCPSLVNDLDLELVQDGKTTLRGNAFNNGASTGGGPADFLNNVEQVIQPSPSGLYTLTVRAAALAGDGIPGNADTTDQDFALVVTNAVVYSGPILAAGAVTPSDTCPGAGAGGNSVLDPGETVVLSVPLVNSGTVTATGVTATLAPPPSGVVVVDGSISYPNIAPGATVNPNPGDTISVAFTNGFSCGGGPDLVLNVTTGQGSFSVPLHLDVGSKTVTNQDLGGTTGPVNDDGNNPSSFTTAAAVAGTLRSVSLDLNIISLDADFLFEDYDITLVSPQATSVTLHSNPLPCAGLLTSYPALRLPQAGSLDTFKGENGGGAWTLRVTDRDNYIAPGPQAGSVGQVNSWTLHLTRESAPACNTCTVTAPGEVSAPGSPTPLTLTYDDVSGEVTFNWQNLGAQADVYRLFSGTLASLSGSGITSSNTSPFLCGDATPGATLVPPSGDRFFLVAAQKGYQLGPLGNATNPASFPRSTSQSCP